jgi:hypothetical protein
VSDGAPISQEIKLPTDSTELGKAVQKLDQLIAAMGKSGEAAKTHGKKVETATQQVRHEFGQMGHAAQYAKTELKDLMEFTGILAGIELMKKLVESVIDVGKEAITAAAAAERMNRVIDSASGGKVAGKENRDWLAEFSKKTEFSEKQSEGAFVDLKRVGTSDQQAKLVIKAAADIAAVSKNKDEAFDATVSAFARLERTNKISNRTLAPLGLGEKDFAALPQFAGMNKKQIKAGIEKGSVTKNDLYALIMARTQEKAIGEKAAGNADLLGTKLSKLSELPEKFYKKLADTAAIRTLTKALDGVLEKLDPESPKGKQISQFLEHIFVEGADLAGKLGEAIDEIDFGQIGDVIKDDVIPAIKTMIDLIGPAVRLLEKTMTGLHEGARLLRDPFGVVRDVATGKITQSAHQQLAEKGALPSTQEHSTASDLTGNTLLSKYTPLGYLQDTVFNPEWWKTKAKAIPEGTAAGIREGTPDVAAAASEMGNQSHEAFMGPAGIDANSPSRKFHYGGQMMGEGVALGYESKADRIMAAMTSTGGPRVTTGGTSSTAGGGRGAVHLSFSDGAIQIHVASHGDKSEVAGMVRDELGKSLVPMLVDALESAQDGAA